MAAPSDALPLAYARPMARGAAAPEASEHDLACRWVPFEEVVAMCRDGRITDALTLIAIGWVAQDRAAGRRAAGSPAPDAPVAG